MAKTEDCSVIILAHNGVEFTRTCVDSLLKADSFPNQLFLIDNGSTDDTPAFIQAVAPAVRERGIEFVTWRNEENVGCSAARNDGWSKAAGKYVVFMDNDTAVCTRNWLSVFRQAMADDAKLGILGARLIYPYKPHPIQCAGVSINQHGRIRFRGRGAARDDRRFAGMETVTALISACWIMRRGLFDEIGGLDPAFHPVQYEDLDYCLRVNEAGYHCAYTAAVDIYHFESMTTASFGDETYLRTIARNSMTFRRRWHGVIQEFGEDSDDYQWAHVDSMQMTDELDLAMIP